MPALLTVTGVSWAWYGRDQGAGGVDGGIVSDLHDVSDGDDAGDGGGVDAGKGRRGGR